MLGHPIYFNRVGENTQPTQHRCLQSKQCTIGYFGPYTHQPQHSCLRDYGSTAQVCIQIPKTKSVHETTLAGRKLINRLYVISTTPYWDNHSYRQPQTKRSVHLKGDEPSTLYPKPIHLEGDDSHHTCLASSPAAELGPASASAAATA